jgi:hypothetical protein
MPRVALPPTVWQTTILATVVPRQIDLICAAFAIRLWELRVVQIGGSRVSSGTQRKLQSVTGAQWLRTPDRRLFALCAHASVRRASRAEHLRTLLCP